MQADSGTTSREPSAEAQRLADRAGGESRVVPQRVVGYSRFVSLAKKLLPVVAILLMVLVVMWPHLQKKDERFRIGFAAIKEQESESPSMVNPRYLGTDDDAQPFSITADLAKNLMSGDSVIELEMPKADITLDDGTWLVLTAQTGLYNRGSQTLDLVGAVNLFHDSGYEFRTSRAYIDLNSGIATGTEPVEGQGPFGSLAADGFRLIDKGKTILFTGKARLEVFPGAGGDIK